jgi:hypothetical protein
VKANKRIRDLGRKAKIFFSKKQEPVRIEEPKIMKATATNSEITKEDPMAEFLKAFEKRR